MRDHHQSKVVEGQGEVAKKLTVIAALVLVPSFIVGYYGQNFESAFDDAYWSIGVSTGSHRRLDARPARDLPLAPLDLSRRASRPSTSTSRVGPGSPAGGRRRLAGSAPWYVAAGWALDLFLGRQTREHDDLEIGVPARPVRRGPEALGGFEFVVVGDGKAWPTTERLAAHRQTGSRTRRPGGST